MARTRVSPAAAIAASVLQNLTNAMGQRRQMQMQDRMLASQEADQAFQRFLQGRRPGTAPVEEAVTIDLPQATFDTSFSPPPMTGGMTGGRDWTQSLRDGFDQSGFAADPVVGKNQAQGTQPPRSAPGAVERAPIPTMRDQAFAGRPVDAEPSATAASKITLPKLGRYQQISPTEYLDTHATPEFRHERASLAVEAAKKAAAEAEQRRLAGLYQGAGLDPAKAELAAVNPGLADDFLKPPEQPKPQALREVTLNDGVWMVDPTSGKKVTRVGDRPVSPTAGAGGGRTRAQIPTEGERKALFFYRRAERAGQMLDQFSEQKTLDAIASKVGMFGNWAKTPEGRRLYQAGQQWAMAVLRQDSGGAITDAEMEQYFQTYLPRPGDDAETLAQKREARRVVTDGLKELAGRALPPEATVPMTDSRVAAPVNPWRTR